VPTVPLGRHVGAVDSVGLDWLLVPFVRPVYSLAAIGGLVEYPISCRSEWFRVERGGRSGRRWSGLGD